MGDAITTLQQVNPVWLTDVLCASGALTRGTVEGFEASAGQGVWSANASLHLRYSDDARGELPRRLFLKLVNADLGDEFFDDSEVRYYTRDYVGVDGAPLVRCYDAAYSAELRRYHVLLDDVSDTHTTAVGKLPTLEHGLALADGLAAMHARWWGARGLAESGARMHSAVHIQRFVDIAEPGVAPILSECSAELMPHWPAAIHELFARHPQRLIQRANDANGFTLIHGDVNLTNTLVPRVGDRPIYLIDRQPFDWSLTTWLGTYDLAYAIALGWAVDARRRLEMPALRRYHAQLCARGVEGYGWSQLFDDYRSCVAMGVYIAVEYCRGGLNAPLKFVWLPMLQRALTACDDLDCAALF